MFRGCGCGAWRYGRANNPPNYSAALVNCYWMQGYRHLLGNHQQLELHLPSNKATVQKAPMLKPMATGSSGTRLAVLCMHARLHLWCGAAMLLQFFTSPGGASAKPWTTMAFAPVRWIVQQPYACSQQTWWTVGICSLRQPQPTTLFGNCYLSAAWMVAMDIVQLDSVRARWTL